MPEWNKAQQNAIDARNSNILVSAAAGSGKTAVLVARVVKMITDPVKPVPLDRLLVVTFTNAAAAEMKSRIAKALTEKIKKEQNNTTLLRQLSLLPAAQICTIDSFCMNLVREHFFQLDIAQDFTVLEESRETLLEESVAQDIIEELYKDDNIDFKSLVELLSTTKNDDTLTEAIREIHRFISAQPYPMEWLKKVSRLYDPSQTMDQGVLKEYVQGEIDFVLEYIEKIINYEKELLDPFDEMYDAYDKMLTLDGELLSSLKAAAVLPWDEMRAVFLETRFSSAPRVKKGYFSEYKDQLLALRKTYSGSDGIFKKNLLPLLAASAKEIHADNAYLYPVFQSLIRIVEEYDLRLMEKKKELNAYSFSDIEHFAIQLLFRSGEEGYVRTPLAEQLSENYVEILVDEYQDTNAAQDMLFEMLSNGKNRFMVGDVKQSIYRFRLAMPSIFNEKRESYSPYDAESASVHQKIVFDKNYRSREGICAFTNFLFSHLMSERVGEMVYGSEDSLNPGAVYPESPVPCAQLNIVDVPENEDKDEYEARQIAAEILRKIEAHEQVKAGDTETRDIRFGDFAVLLRSAKKAMPVFSKVFSEFGIPTVSNNRTNLFDNHEVAILLSLLRVVDNPVQDIPLLATLLSVFYGYSPDQIATARVGKKKGNLYSAITSDPAFLRFAEDLMRYRKYAASMSVEGLIRQILSETCYLSLIAAMGNYEQRKLNVMKVIELAKRFDDGENVGLTAFIRYIDSVTEAKLEVESAELSGYEDNAVQLMSIHKSKGLEFPVVILAGSSRKYHLQDGFGAVLLNEKLGVGLKVNQEEELYRYESLQYSVMKNHNLRAAMSENLRVLYVAVTRAKEQFIAYASFRNAPRQVELISQKIMGGEITDYTVANAKCDADLLLMCALLHQDSAALKSTLHLNIPADGHYNFALSVSSPSGAQSEEVEAALSVPADETLVEEIRNRLSFTYERLGIAAYSSKRTASSLDEKEQNFRYFAKSKPAFLTGKTMTGADKGTAMHAFMQYCDYANAKSDLAAEIDRLVTEGYLTELQADSLNRKKLATLFSSAFARRMFESDGIHREIKVASFVPLCELEDTEYTDPVLVQGIADCVFEEDGALVLVDYKTDVVESEEELLSRYQKQLSFYKSAVEKTLEMPVKETLLYSFYLDKICKY